MNTSRFLLLTFYLLMSAISLHSTPVTLQKARMVAIKYYSELCHLQKGSIPVNTALLGAEYIGDSLQPQIYIFNLPDNQGFILVSGDDVSYPILAYSMNGNFRNDPMEWPEGFQLFLRSYQLQIEAIRKLSLVQSPEIANKWNMLSDEPFASTTQMTDVGPLLTSTWDQTCWYNAFCPADPAGSCGHTVTGCGATAVGQIIRYYEYPLHGTGEYGYTHPQYGYISVNFAAATYEYDQMPDEATETNYAEIAKLLYHCGVACQTNYGPDGSSSHKIPMRDALVNYFGYSPNADVIFKANYSDNQWKAMLRNELDHQRPIMYDGAESEIAPGHAFVCDGYQQNDYFHFNWGWSGLYNGYFLLTDLSPGTHNFSPFQSAIIGIFPDTLKCTPPLHLSASVNTNDVTLNWSVPSPVPITDWIHYDNEYLASTEFVNNINYKVAMRFDTSQLTPYGGMKLTKIKLIVGNPDAEYRLNVWKGANASTTLLDDEIPDQFCLDWEDIYGNHEVLYNTFILAEPIIVDPRQELWIGYSCINTAVEKPAAGHDNGPSVTGYGDMIYFDNDYWRSMHVTYPTWNYNWNIEAFVTDVYGNTYTLKSVEPETDELALSNAARSFSSNSDEQQAILHGYNIQRDGTQINSQLITQLTYADEDLSPGIYTYTVTAVYDSGTSVPSGPAVAIVEETILNPPFQLSAQIIGTNVQLTWYEPLPPAMEEWIHYDDGYNYATIGLSNGGSFNVAMRFTPEQLVDYAGMYISRVCIFACALNTTYSLFISKGNNATVSLAEIPLSNIQLDQWDTIPLSPPVPIDISQELWIGYKIFNHPANDKPAGIDNGPAVAGYGDMLSTNGTTYASLYQSTGLNYNWNIEALATNQPGELKYSPVISHPLSELLGYNLYRNNTKVNTSIISDTSWLDTGLPPGAYNYFVKALYDAGESGPSNIASVNLPVGINESNQGSVARLYPNPADEYLIVESDVTINAVTLTDIIGAQYYTECIDSKFLKINTQDLPPGIYLVQVRTCNGTITGKISIR